MDLEVKPAGSDHIEFAWNIYAPYVQENLFNGGEGLMAPEKWSHDEEHSKFLSSWESSDQYVISVDGQPVGWLSATQDGRELTIENLMIAPEWRGRNIAETFLVEMSKQWREEGTVVRGNILQKTEFTESITAISKRAGFVEVGASGNSATLQLN
jgi:hypothetical protein